MCVRMCMRVCVCVCARMHACVGACVCVCVFAGLTNGPGGLAAVVISSPAQNLVGQGPVRT